MAHSSDPRSNPLDPVNPLIEVQRHGQSIWYDFIRRSLLTSGELQALVDRDGVLGVTSNPAIFEKAIAGSPDYDPALAALVGDETKAGASDAKAIYENLAIADIQLAADIMRPVYDRTERRDGFVSLEVSPYLADDTDRTVAEAQRLFAAVARPNVMIKVPATEAGIPAIQTLVAHGIPINVTLLFSIEFYKRAAEAYLAGLEGRLAAGLPIAGVASVASFFLSRIDSAVDAKVEAALDATRDAGRRRGLKSVLGKIAIANARVAYAELEAILLSDRFAALAANGAQPQRLLWASTSTKNPKYPKTMYVDELIGPHTVNTLPIVTFEAFRESGTAAASLVDPNGERLDAARATLASLAETRIDLDTVTDALLAKGVHKFAAAFDKLLAAVERKRQLLLGDNLGRQTLALGDEAARDVAARQDAWRAAGNVRRLWRADSSLWSGNDEGRWLGWLHALDGATDGLDALLAIAIDIRDAGFRDVVVLGMGGSSLCPDVLARTFGTVDGHPRLRVLDSVVPAQIRAVEAAVDLDHTLFIVASKSGGTMEPNTLYRYFRDRLQHLERPTGARSGSAAGPGSRFIAITDPGSALHKLAKRDGFRHIALGEPSIGGRFSALSNFGLVPAAAMGLDVPAYLDSTDVMVQSCAPCVPPEVNPGVTLGLTLGTLALRGRDKLTLVMSPGLEALGAWLEQLVAESTGKLGHGIVPIAGEQLATADAYGDDRVFVYSFLATDGELAGKDLANQVAALEAAGHPVVRIRVDEALDLGQEFYRWEMATAVIGAVLGINPFDQPDVEAAKVAAKKLAAAYEESGKLPEATPVCETDSVQLFADPDLEARVASATSSDGADLAAVLRAHLARLTAGDYFAINAFVEMSEVNDRHLDAIRHTVRDRKRVATTVGYGPRFLHSTGQLHKGGPASGSFLVITSDDAEDLAVPGERLSFGVLKQAQALGDFDVLLERGRRALRIHLGADVAAGLHALHTTIQTVTAAER